MYLIIPTYTTEKLLWAPAVGGRVTICTPLKWERVQAGQLIGRGALVTTIEIIQLPRHMVT